MGNILIPALVILGFGALSAYAAGKDMKEGELKALLEGGKTLQLGGKGMGYTGTLDLAADGTGKGSAQPDSGDKIVINGTWRIKGDEFCRTWEALDDGKEVCERWRLVAPNKVEVYSGKEMMGVNSW
ncbi:MAG TPA: hypothetical protein VGN93_13260 [Shinella sp.]|jgi:hypothetical protein|uniref:hypothetical protein n=1 Tax=Shinella sp. TaxID=1870904 RepID=UPI002E104ED7|nr:hypothetical protein [Shinella sp.]